MPKALPETSVRIPSKLYALMRMRIAIDRAIAAPTLEGKEKAARWAAVWGEVAGIPKASQKHRTVAPNRSDKTANGVQGSQGLVHRTAQGTETQVNVSV